MRKNPETIRNFNQKIGNCKSGCNSPNSNSPNDYPGTNIYNGPHIPNSRSKHPFRTAIIHQHSTANLRLYPIFRLPRHRIRTDGQTRHVPSIYIYSPDNESKEPIWVAIEIASTRSSLHRWETCLINWYISKGYQPKVTQIELKDITLNENPPIIGRYFAFTYRNTNQTQAVLYWYETATFTINQTSQRKNVKISLIAFPNSPENLPIIEAQLTTIAETVTKYWQPIKTWSQITMIVSQNGLTLTAITTTILATIIIIYLLEIQRQKKANTNAYHKLSEVNKQTADIVKETENKRLIPTLSNIAETYREKTGKPITKTHLLKSLTEVEKTGIIKRIIINNKDEPLVIWKTQIKLK